MKKKTIVFNGVSYDCRVVRSKDGEELIIGSTKLLDVLQPGSFDGENGGFASKDAETLYDEVFYFVAVDDLKLSDGELIEVLKDSNPEWFE